jgi:hypothetical protein
MTRFEHSALVASGDWIAPRLLGAFGAVGRVCPTGYEAYARVFHPVGEERLSWADVCAATGRTPHAEMQWHRVSRPVDDTAGAWHDDPSTGTIDADSLALLTGAVGVDGPVTIGLWYGYGFPYPHPEPTLVLPMREYVLYRGRLATLRDPAWTSASEWSWAGGQTFNIAWPDDRSWFVASEIDFDSTVVGGSRALVDRVLSSGLESAEVTAASDLSSEGDRINR